MSLAIVRALVVLGLRHRRFIGRHERIECLRGHVSGDDDVDDVYIELLMLGAQKLLRICFTPSVGWLTLLNAPRRGLRTSATEEVAQFGKNKI